MRAHNATAGWSDIEWPHGCGASGAPSGGDLGRLDDEFELVIEQVQESHERSRRAFKRLVENLTR